MWINGLKLLIISVLAINTTSSYALNISGAEFSPFVQKDPNGKISGPFLEMIKDVCKEMNEECQFSLLPNKRLKHMVRHGQVDAGFAYGWNEKRADIYIIQCHLCLRNMDSLFLLLITSSLRAQLTSKGTMLVFLGLNLICHTPYTKYESK